MVPNSTTLDRETGLLFVQGQEKLIIIINLSFRSEARSLSLQRSSLFLSLELFPIYPSQSVFCTKFLAETYFCCSCSQVLLIASIDPVCSDLSTPWVILGFGDFRECSLFISLSHHSFLKTQWISGILIYVLLVLRLNSMQMMIVRFGFISVLKKHFI